MVEYTDDNVKFIYLSGTSEYQCEYNPSNTFIWWEHLQLTNQLDDGSDKFYHKGYKAHLTLEWEQPLFFKSDQYNMLRNIFNQHTSIIVNLTPSSSTGASYGMQWVNNFDFAFVAGVTMFGYAGIMQLVGTSIYSDVPSDIVYGNG